MSSISVSSISAYLRFDFPRLPPFARLRPFEIDFSRCKYRSPGCGLGMFSRLSEADGVLINLKLFFSCPPVASRRRFERSVARLCSMVVIFRFARATTPGHMRVLVSICAALCHVCEQEGSYALSLWRLLRSGLFLRGVHAGPRTLRTDSRVLSPPPPLKAGTENIRTSLHSCAQREWSALARHPALHGRGKRIQHSMATLAAAFGTVRLHPQVRLRVITVAATVR